MGSHDQPLNLFYIFVFNISALTLVTLFKQAHLGHFFSILWAFVVTSSFIKKVEILQKRRMHNLVHDLFVLRTLGIDPRPSMAPRVIPVR